MDSSQTRTSLLPTPLRTSLLVSRFEEREFWGQIWFQSSGFSYEILFNNADCLNLNLAPKLAANKDKDYLKKKNYGQVPKYVTKIKQEIEDEYNLVREMQIEEQNEKDRQKMLMPEEERQELIAALKKKWEVLHHKFQKESIHSKLDTIGKKTRKENLEKEMD